jgi:hypothetical protein
LNKKILTRGNGKKEAPHQGKEVVGELISTTSGADSDNDCFYERKKTEQKKCSQVASVEEKKTELNVRQTVRKCRLTINEQSKSATAAT